MYYRFYAEMVEEYKTYEIEVMTARRHSVCSDSVDNQVMIDLKDFKGDYEDFIYNVVSVKQKQDDKPTSQDKFKDFLTNLVQILKEVDISDEKVKEMDLLLKKYLIEN